MNNFPVLSLLLEELKRRGGTIDNEQFFTNPEVASHVSSVIKGMPFFKKIKTFIEPSAGAGAILKHFPGARGFDLEPQGKDIEKADFLQTTLSTIPEETLVFGNPPFGRQGALALKFIRKASEYANYIAFILPAIFAKGGTQSKIPKDFHLTHEELLPANAFVSPKGAILNVRCVLQIWERKDEPRVDAKFDQSQTPIKFVKSSEADIAVRKIGDRTLGKIVDVKDAVPESSFFFLKDIPGLKDAIKSSTFDHILGTAGKGLRSIDRLAFSKEVQKHL